MRLFEDLDVYAYRKGWPRWACILVPIFYPSTWPIVAYRFGAWVVRLRSGPLRHLLYLLYFPLKRITEILTTVEISEHAQIGEGLFVAHIGSIVISHDTKIGRYASMHQGVTIGVMGRDGSSEKMPEIGDCVYFGAGAKIIGPIKIGDNVVVGANAVVTRDVPDNAIVVGVPASFHPETLTP